MSTTTAQYVPKTATRLFPFFKFFLLEVKMSELISAPLFPHAVETLQLYICCIWIVVKSLKETPLTAVLGTKVYNMEKIINNTLRYYTSGIIQPWACLCVCVCVCVCVRVCVCVKS